MGHLREPPRARIESRLLDFKKAIRACSRSKVIQTEDPLPANRVHPIGDETNAAPHERLFLSPEGMAWHDGKGGLWSTVEADRARGSLAGRAIGFLDLRPVVRTIE